MSNEMQRAAKAAAILRYGMSGPIAAMDMAWQQRHSIAKIGLSLGFLFLLPVLFLCMLPSFVFGSFHMTDVWNDNAVLLQNIQRYQTAVWSAIEEAHDDLLQEIEVLAEDDEEITILDDFSYSSVNATLILCQYSAAKGKDEIKTKEIIGQIKAHSGALFSYEKTSAHTYRVYYVGDAYFADRIFKLTEKQKLLAEWYAANLELFLYGSQCGGVSAWVSEDVLKYRNLVEKYAEKTGVQGLHPAVFHLYMSDFMKRYQESGLKIRVWTVNREKDMKNFIEAGLEAVITNYPDTAIEVRRQVNHA